MTEVHKGNIIIYEKYNNRITVNVSSAGVILLAITASDAGQYKLTVDLDPQKTRIYTLTVVPWTNDRHTLAEGKPVAFPDAGPGAFTRLTWTFNNGSEHAVGTVDEGSADVSGAFAGRAELGANGSLTLGAVRPEDTGRYALSVEGQAGRGRDRTLTLIVYREDDRSAGREARAGERFVLTEGAPIHFVFEAGVEGNYTMQLQRRSAGLAVCYFETNSSLLLEAPGFENRTAVRPGNATLLEARCADGGEYRVTVSGGGRVDFAVYAPRQCASYSAAVALGAAPRLLPPSTATPLDAEARWTCGGREMAGAGILCAWERPAERGDDGSNCTFVDSSGVRRVVRLNVTEQPRVSSEPCARPHRWWCGGAPATPPFYVPDEAAGTLTGFGSLAHCECRRPGRRRGTAAGALVLVACAVTALAVRMYLSRSPPPPPPIIKASIHLTTRQWRHWWWCRRRRCRRRHRCRRSAGSVAPRRGRRRRRRRGWRARRRPRRRRRWRPGRRPRRSRGRGRRAAVGPAAPCPHRRRART